jgi:hypothetical protein
MPEVSNKRFGWTYIYVADDVPQSVPYDVVIIQYINYLIPNTYCSEYIHESKTSYTECINFENNTITRYYPFLSINEVIIIYPNHRRISMSCRSSDFSKL